MPVHLRYNFAVGRNIQEYGAANYIIQQDIRLIDICTHSVKNTSYQIRFQIQLRRVMHRGKQSHEIGFINLETMV
jgi:hypothetical protein